MFHDQRNYETIRPFANLETSVTELDTLKFECLTPTRAEFSTLMQMEFPFFV